MKGDGLDPKDRRRVEDPDIQKKPGVHGVDDRPTRPLVEDQLLYLLFELERVVTHSTIKWSPELVAGVQGRLEGLVDAVRRIGKR